MLILHQQIKVTVAYKQDTSPNKLNLGVGTYRTEVLQHAKPLKQLPLVGPLFTPPVKVTAVAKVAVRAATDPVFPPGIVDVYGILQYAQQRSK